MKNYNRRGLIIGIVQLFLSVFCFITMIVTGFDVKLAVLGIIIALLGITSVINSFSKEETRKELIENEDERSQLVKIWFSVRGQPYPSAGLAISSHTFIMNQRIRRTSR